MFKRKKSVNKKLLEHKLYLARENPEPVFNLSDCNLINIPSGIFSLCKVFLKESLILCNNQLDSLSGGGDLKDLNTLKLLNINFNDFHTLPEDIRFLINLEELYLDNNQLKHLPDSICELENLKILSCINNNLKTLPHELGNLKNLEKLYLNGNSQLKMLPNSIYKAKKLQDLNLDSEQIIYPPKNIIENGAKAIIEFLCKEMGIEYNSHNSNDDDTVDNDEASPFGNFENDFKEPPDKLQQNRLKDFLEIERNNEILQKQEIELANIHRMNREKLLVSITRRQSKLDLELSKFQQEREIDRFRLIEQLQQVENNADIAIKNLLSINKDPLGQLLEKEHEDEENFISSLTQYNNTLNKDKILCEMENILEQENETFKKFNLNKMEISRSILEQEIRRDFKLYEVFHNQDLHKANLTAKLIEDSNLQKAAVGTLLERGDSRSWGLLQQIRLIELQLTALTNVEIDRKKLKMDEHLNDLAEKRMRLSDLLMDLLEKQQERREQLLLTLRNMEKNNEDRNAEFWLRQYQYLLEKLPKGLSQAQKNIDPKLTDILLANEVLHYLPFMAKLLQEKVNVKIITESELIEAGIKDKIDRKKILESFSNYSFKPYNNENFNSLPSPSAPPTENEPSAPSAPPENTIKTITTIECVVCMELECHIIFVPCGHLCCCSNCSVAIHQCPLCRTKIERKISMISQ